MASDAVKTKYASNWEAIEAWQQAMWEVIRENAKKTAEWRAFDRELTQEWVAL